MDDVHQLFPERQIAGLCGNNADVARATRANMNCSIRCWGSAI
jgi:hypothetical protein